MNNIRSHVLMGLAVLGLVVGCAESSREYRLTCLIDGQQTMVTPWYNNSSFVRSEHHKMIVWHLPSGSYIQRWGEVCYVEWRPKEKPHV